MEEMWGGGGGGMRCGSVGKIYENFSAKQSACCVNMLWGRNASPYLGVQRERGKNWKETEWWT